MDISRQDSPNRHPTRDDVAAHAGVSSAVVSYVVNGGPRPVAPDTRQRVLDAIRQLDYRPNEIARSLAGRSTSTVGFIAPTLLNPVWAGVSMGINEVLRGQSHLLMVCDVGDQTGRESEYARMLVAKRVDGVVLVPTVDAGETLEILERGKVPVVVVERECDTVPSVVVDAEASGRIVTEHLLSLGHTRIAILREPRTGLDSWKRYLGYRQALDSAGIAPDDRLVVDAAADLHGGIVESGLAAAGRLLDVDPRPTAVFAHNDLMAIAVIHVASQLGLDVPADLSVVGIDDIEAGRYLQPPLSTLPFPQHELGNAAARKLLDVIAGEPRESVTILTPPELIVRGSTARPGSTGEMGFG